jgi:membrane-associated phospholipid phosphatase
MLHDWANVRVPRLTVHASGITDFADPAVLLPIAAATLFVLVVRGWRRGAIAWVTALGWTVGLILILKLRFFACDQLIPEERIRNPSGHTAAAAVVYGSLGITIVRSTLDLRRWLIPVTIAMTLPIVVVIGASRLNLDQHSIAEVIAGGCIGIAGAVSFVLLAGPPTHNLGVIRLLLVSVMTIALLHGIRVSIEGPLEHLATDIRNIVPGTRVPVC